MKLRNKNTGAVVSVSAETAARLGNSWEKVSAPVKEPVQKAVPKAAPKKVAKKK